MTHSALQAPTEEIMTTFRQFDFDMKYDSNNNLIYLSTLLVSRSTMKLLHFFRDNFYTIFHGFKIILRKMKKYSNNKLNLNIMKCRYKLSLHA